MPPLESQVINVFNLIMAQYWPVFAFMAVVFIGSAAWSIIQIAFGGSRRNG